MIEGHRLDRDELYREVWTEAMTKVSKRYGISDVALAKVCRKMAIPVPERGYWARVGAGHKVKRSPLPARGQGIPQMVEVHPNQAVRWIGDLRAADLAPIPVSGTLTSPHRLTLQLQKVLSRAKPDSYGRVRSSREDIDVNVGPESVPRVLVFVDAFVKAAEERGFSFAGAATEYELGLSIVINGQKVRFSILEGSRRSSPVASMNTARGTSQVGSREFHPSGRLSFKIREYLRDRNEPTFSDRAHEPLERQLSIILHGLAQAAIELRKRAEERAKEEKLAQERAEQHRRAEIQHKKLEDDLANWSKAETIRRFLRQVEHGMEASGPADPAYAQRWLDWAGAIATRLDPLAEGLDVFFRHYLEFGWDKMSRHR